MFTYNAIKGALMALAAQGSVTITVPDEIGKRLNLGDIEITIQMPKTNETHPNAPATAEPETAPGEVEAESAPAETAAPAAPAETGAEAAPAETTTKAAPAEVATKTSPTQTRGQDATEQVKQTGYEGLWYDHSGRSAIKIDKCGAGLCGKIAWLKNSDHKSVCGTDIIGGVRKVGSVYDNGWIYDIERGRKFDVELKLLSEKQLRVKGYAGTKFLSKTMIWKRAPSDLTLCS